MATEDSNPMEIIRASATRKEYGIAQTTIKGWENAGLFPKRRKFGPRVAGWFRSEFEQGLRDVSR